ncbi:phosphoribosyl-AMP cyclohydrolase [Methanosphaera cuniculi]|uniref:Phosphoribosyl-AMP cyclohydrolase n=1 Tax=Methanosphaera cuniculi TaxID=1077256 RepID=A0A2V2BTW4_9EURY|nr:phosphoribosyl-AMP cyclohydrolase [Methanosphaera cuniculi]
MIELNFRHKIGDKELATAIAQDYETGEVLMVAFINKEAYEKSVKTRKAHYYSTSRDEVWFKGEISGHIQKIHEIHIDCDRDAVLFKVEQIGGACHTGHYSCFYTEITDDGENIKENKNNIVFNPDIVYKE